MEAGDGGGEMYACTCTSIEEDSIMYLYMVWYGNSLFGTTYKYTHLNILHN